MNEVILPTVRGMAQDGIVYTGFLYAGLMIAPDGTPRVLEFNCRFGDPETQPIMLRLQSDLVALCLAAVEGRLDSEPAEWDPRPALGVVLAAGGYPDSYVKGDVIRGLPVRESIDAKVFHAGTRRQGEDIVTSGGRVLCAYALARQIHWHNVYYRTDIGYRAIARETGGH
jgi:phosphoribosylamine--glycine ligase